MAKAGSKRLHSNNAKDRACHSARPMCRLLLQRKLRLCCLPRLSKWLMRFRFRVYCLKESLRRDLVQKKGFKEGAYEGCSPGLGVRGLARKVLR